MERRRNDRNATLAPSRDSCDSDRVSRVLCNAARRRNGHSVRALCSPISPIPLQSYSCAAANQSYRCAAANRTTLRRRLSSRPCVHSRPAESKLGCSGGDSTLASGRTATEGRSGAAGSITKACRAGGYTEGVQQHRRRQNLSKESRRRRVVRRETRQD